MHLPALLLLLLATTIHAQIDFNSHLQRVNQLRAQAGAPPLQIDSRLNSCAQAHAQDMSSNVGLTHTGSNGSTPGDRIRRCVGESNIFAGENAARGGYTTDEEVITDWFNSPGHRANLLNANYDVIGIGRVGQFWAQNFAGGLSSNPPRSPSPSPRPVQQSPRPVQQSPRPVSPSPRPVVVPSPPRPVAPSPAVVPTTLPANRATNTLVRPTTVTRVPPRTVTRPATFINPFNPSSTATPVVGELLENIPGIDSIVPDTFDTSGADTSGASLDDIDERIYAGNEEERKKSIAEAAVKGLTEEERVAYEAAKIVYKDEFNPFLLMGSGGRVKVGWVCGIVAVGFGVLLGL